MRPPLPAKTVFGAYLRECRLRHNLTLKQVASRVQVTERYLYNLESGTQSPPSHLLLHTLAQTFEIPVKELYKRADRIPVNLRLLMQQHALLAELLYELGQEALPDECYQELLLMVEKEKGKG